MRQLLLLVSNTVLKIHKLQLILCICFENAKWAYVCGAAIAIKKGVKTAADAAEGDTSKAVETVAGTYADNETATFAPAAGGKWENKYFRVVYNLSSSAASKNYGVRLLELKLVF